MMKSSVMIGAAAVALFAGAALAQGASVIGAGTRVRISAPTLDQSEQVGRVVSSSSDTIQFRSDANPFVRSIAVVDLTALEVSGGMRTHRGRDALYGLAIGGIAGAIAGAASYKDPGPNCWFFCETRSGDALGGGVLGGLAGTLIGGFIVGSLDRSERWIPLRHTAKVSIAPTAHGAALTLSRTF